MTEIPQKNKSVVTTVQNVRNFQYTKDGVNLNFGLNMDGDKELLSFKECLELAIKDIDEILASRK